MHASNHAPGFSFLRQAFTALLLISATHFAAAQNTFATISTGKSPTAVAANPSRNSLYVANSGDNSVTMVNATNHRTALIPVGTKPVAIAVNPFCPYIYVVNYGDGTNPGTVSVVNQYSNTVLTTATVGRGPSAASVDPGTGQVFVANRLDGTVTVLSLTGSVVATVKTGSYPTAIATNSATHLTYVANYGSSNVTVIGPGTTTATVTAGSGPSALGINAATNKIYVANSRADNLTVIDGSNNGTATVETGELPHAVVVDPVANKIYVANAQSAFITVIDGNDNSTANVELPSPTMELGVNASAGDVYAVSSASKFVYRIHDANTVTQAPVGDSPEAIAVNPITNRIYVANTNDANLSVVDGTTWNHTTVKVSHAGEVPLINPVTNKLYLCHELSDVSSAPPGSVTIVDLATLSKTSVTAGAIGTCPMDLNPITNKLYVGGNPFTVVDGASDTSTTLDLLSEELVAVNPVTNKIYAAQPDIVELDGASNTFKTVASSGSSNTPGSIAINPATNRLYVSSLGYPVAPLSVYDASTAQSWGIWQSPLPALNLQVNSRTNQIYVPNLSGMAAVNGASEAVTNTVAGNPQGNFFYFSAALNPITNQIYGDWASPKPGISDDWVFYGFSNRLANYSASPHLGPVVVNSANNEFYGASWNGKNNSISVVDGVTNLLITSFPLANTNDSSVDQIASQIAVQPWTNTIVTTLAEDGTVDIFSPDSQSVPITTTITPLPANTSTTPTPQFSFAAVNSFTTSAPPPVAVFYQVDTKDGVWNASVSDGSGAFHATLAPLTPGLHTLFAFAVDGQEATTTGAQSSPLVGTVTAYMFLVAPPQPAAMLTPSPESLMSGSSATFTWTAVDAATDYKLDVGTTPGASDIASIDAGTATSAAVTGLPTNGSWFYVTLFSAIDGQWYSNGYAYVAASDLQAQLVSPAPGSTINSSTALFQWTTDAPMTDNWLTIGTAPGKTDIWNTDSGTALSQTVSGLPLNGKPIYVTLNWCFRRNPCQKASYTYNMATSTPGVLTTPTPGSDIPPGPVTFGWTPGTGITDYFLGIGLKPGAHDFFQADAGTNTSYTVNIPVAWKGLIFWMTVYSWNGTTWSSNTTAYGIE